MIATDFDDIQTQPIRQILLTPSSIICCRVEGAKSRIVHYRFVRLDERITHPQLKWSAGGGFELSQAR
jgi:hypothetical protein